MRALFRAPLLAVCSCITLEGAQLHPSPVRSRSDIAPLPVELSANITRDAPCNVSPVVTVEAWREAVERSLKTYGAPEGKARPGIRLEKMEPLCGAEYRTGLAQVRYRARLFGPSGEELAATNGIASGTPFRFTDGQGAILSSLSIALELATQQAISPLLERSEALSLSTTR